MIGMMTERGTERKNGGMTERQSVREEEKSESREQVIEIKCAYLDDHGNPRASYACYGKDRPYLADSLWAAVFELSLEAVIWIDLTGVAALTTSGHSERENPV